MNSMTCWRPAIRSGPVDATLWGRFPTVRGIWVTVGLLAASVAFTGCGASTHENNPRPPVPTVVSISVGADEIGAKPAEGNAVGIARVRQPYLNQNANAPQNQADRKVPAVVNLAIANLTDQATKLVIEGPVERVVPLTANGSGSLNLAMPTGIYRISSPASSDTTLLAVGPSRVSSGGDLLLP